MQKFDRKSLICCDDDAFVAYLYSEMPTLEREAFEDHLLVCAPCTDDFASVADSRYSVVEWKKLDFDPLETPVFQIPYAKANASYSWVDSFKDLFAAGPRLATAGALGLVIAVIGFAIFAGSFTGLELAVVPPVPETESNEIRAPVSATPVKNSDDFDTPVIKPALAATGNNAPKKVKRRVETVALKAPIAKRSTDTVQVPRLNEFDDLSDDSLRLADLVSDLGSLED